MVTSLAVAVREALMAVPDASQIASLRRSSTLYSQDQPAEAAYLINEGLVKLTRSSQTGSRIILAILGAGQLIGEEVFSEDARVYYTEAEVVSQGSFTRIPRESLLKTLTGDSPVARALVTYTLNRKLALAQKVELLCLHDVEYRILHYLAELSSLVTPPPDGDGYQIPITQLELADLIGATRETTSTTLNQLERRGLIKLSRRLMIVPSPETLLTAAQTRSNGVSAASTSMA